MFDLTHTHEGSQAHMCAPSTVFTLRLERPFSRDLIYTSKKYWKLLGEIMQIWFGFQWVGVSMTGVKDPGLAN